MNKLALVIVASIGFGALINSSAVIIGQVDTFEDGTTQNWGVSLLGLGLHPAPPVNTVGGPGGPDDNFLRVTALGGQGPGARLSVINFMDQWSGDYLEAEVASLAMDIRNFGNSDLYLRLAFSDPVTGPPSNIAFSSLPVLVPAGGDWMSVVFPIRPGDLTSGLGSVESALADATELRIYHSQSLSFPNPVFPIEPVVALLGIDNIEARAASVPDGGSSALLFALAAGVMVIVRQRTAAHANP